MVQQVTPVAEPVTPAAPVVETPPAAVAPTAPVVPQGAPTPEPVAPAAPTPVAPAAPVITPEAQAYIEELEAQNRVNQARADGALVQEYVNRVKTQLIQQDGLTEEQAEKIARVEVGRAVDRHRAEEFRIGQFNAAIAIAEQYKIDPRHLMGLPTERAMYETAKAVTLQSRESARVAQLEAEVARLKKAPVTTYANGAAGADGTAVTKDNIHGLWLAGRVSDVKYRNFIKTGQIS